MLNCRFQEIALPVETSVATIFDGAKGGRDDDGKKFQLEATHVALDAIGRCWSPDIFVQALSHRFWKLTLQIVSRYSGAAAAAPDTTVPAATKPEGGEMKPSATVATNMRDMASSRGHARSASLVNAQQHGEAAEDSQEKYSSRPADLIKLWLDVKSFAEHLDQTVLPRIILPMLEQDLTEQQQEVVKAAFEEGCEQLRSNLPNISSLMVDHVTEQCLPTLKQVSDIPRLYRRTNREVPSRPCAYVSATLSPVSAFRKEHLELCGEDVVRPWTVQVFNRVAVQFLANVSEVLAAVQKMEESLKRLKRVRSVY